MGSQRAIVSRQDRLPLAARASAVPATIIELGSRYPGAAAFFAAPLTVAGIWGMVTRPALALPLVALVGVALILTECLASPYRVAQQKGRVAGGTQNRNRQPRVNQTPTADQAEAAAAQVESRCGWLKAGGRCAGAGRNRASRSAGR